MVRVGGRLSVDGENEARGLVEAGAISDDVGGRVRGRGATRADRKGVGSLREGSVVAENILDRAVSRERNPEGLEATLDTGGQGSRSDEDGEGVDHVVAVKERVEQGGKAEVGEALETEGVVETLSDDP